MGYGCASLLRPMPSRRLREWWTPSAKCCLFLRFVITVEPDGGAVSLELSGTPGTREFIAGLLDL